MKVELKRIDEDFHFEANGEAGVPVHIDAAGGIGGHDAGARPMELLLMSAGSCSAIDVILILRKQKQDLKDLQITIEGEREKGKHVSVFTRINLHFRLKGRLSTLKVERALHLSMEKYCSAVTMLRKTAEITYSYEITGE
jgi:putative redox protein